jgi:hypothetical protein
MTTMRWTIPSGAIQLYEYVGGWLEEAHKVDRRMSGRIEVVSFDLPRLFHSRQTVQLCHGCKAASRAGGSPNGERAAAAFRRRHAHD